MSDQHPVYSPPPNYAPADAPAGYGADAGSSVPGQQPPQPAQPNSSGKKKTIIIVGIVVAVLALCCCVGGGGLAYFLFAVDSTSTSSEIPFVEEFGNDTTTEVDDARLQEWYDWAPEPAAMLDEAPAPAESLVVEALGVAAPNFSLDEAVWWEGYYDETDDWYYADAFYVRATHPSSSDVSAAVELWIQSDLMIAEDVAFEPEPDLDIVTTIADGTRELLYDPQWGPGFVLATDDDTALWEQIGRDWPEAVVVNGTDAGDGSGYFEVELTKWEIYAVDGEYPTVVVTYENVDGEWSLVSWEYSYPEASSETPTI